MSYEIIYGKQVVKLARTDEVIIMLLAGSNNCYEIRPGGGQRRERNWFNFRYYCEEDFLGIKPNVLFDKLNAEIESCIKKRLVSPYKDAGDTPENIREHYGYYVSLSLCNQKCSDLSWDKYVNIFHKGIQNALTIEQLDSIGVNLLFDTYGTEGYPSPIPIKTEDSYYTELEKWQKWKAEKENNFFCLTFSPRNYELVLDLLKRKIEMPAEQGKDITPALF